MKMHVLKSSKGKVIKIQLMNNETITGRITYYNNDMVYILVKDVITYIPIQSIIYFSFPKNENVVLFDTRDDKEYKTIQIGNQIWMAENLAYETSFGSCTYEDNKKNTEKYGRLYSIDALKMACPSGWHIPTNFEWYELESFIGADKSNLLNHTRHEHWDMLIKGKGATIGFDALPSGYRNDEGDFVDLGKFGCWWTDFSHSDFLEEFFNDEKSKEKPYYSIRCIKNN